MKPIIWKILKFVNVIVGFCISLLLVAKGFGIFAIVLAIYVTYLNTIIDEILEGTD
jgi:hypothetical protein